VLKINILTSTPRPTLAKLDTVILEEVRTFLQRELDEAVVEGLGRGRDERRSALVVKQVP